jgi:hypothetical protein
MLISVGDDRRERSYVANQLCHALAKIFPAPG